MQSVTIGNATLYCGDCLNVLKQMPDNSVDACVTDPPAGIGFMGKDWDKNKGGRDQWIEWMCAIAKETKRVLKPGAHALVWSLPRTSHWTATAWENAGFEPRDRIAHCFGSGFPKSLDVSKAIDKMAGADREVVGEKRYGTSKRTWCIDDGGMHDRRKLNPKTGLRHVPQTISATESAKQWQGFGTALKPAIEDWWLMRKPLIGTVAENVLTHGTGALNVDGCRIEIDIDEAEKSKDFRTTAGGGGSHIPLPNQSFRDDLKKRSPVENHHHLSLRHNALGRFPSNFIHDGSNEVVALFPQQKSGEIKPLSMHNKRKDFLKGVESHLYHVPATQGSAARFFYCAKASQKDRDSGTEDRNHHPTVKPVNLMRYLCRLITPPGGIILDPFMGSGSTGKAAMLEGFHFIGIELQPEYFDIACKRIEDAQRQSELALVV